MSNIVHAQFINLEDNVPFQRVYKSPRKFVSGYTRMKDAVLDHAVDYAGCVVVRPTNFDSYAQGIN